MPKIQRLETIEHRQPFKVYSDVELRNFDKEMREKYRKPVKLSTGEEVFIFDYNQFYFDNGGTDEQGAIFTTIDSQGRAAVIHRYLELVDKIEQWDKWAGRQSYGKKMATQQFNRMAMEQLHDNMKITNVDKEDDFNF
jgi:hypothetical protein